jgi:hypothetical protein
MLLVCLCVLIINFWMAEAMFIELDDMATEPISAGYFINPSHLFLCLCDYPLTVAWERPCQVEYV